MKSQSSMKSKYFWATIIATSILIFFFYGKIVLSPSDYLFEAEGDGFTSYYNTSWHIEYDSSYTEFKGSNYPFGEHTVYSEYRLLISNSIKAVGEFFPSIKNYNIAFTNLSILFSILLSSIFLFFILKKLGVRNSLCFTGAIGITFLAPQVGRFDNHLTLAYMCFIPITWYLIFLFFEKEKKWLFSILLAINSAAWFFIHSYLGLIAVSFVLAVWIVFILRKSEWKIPTNYLHLFIQVASPLLFFFSFVKMTDIHEDRTENPLGFYLYNAEPDDIFLPHHAPLRPLLNQFFDIHLKWEAWSYVGLLTTLTLLFLIFHFIKKTFQQKSVSGADRFPKIEYLQHPHLKIVFPASVLLLMFAFGLPFKTYPPSLDWFPLLKNFRTTGRFGWVFFYVSTVSVVYFLNEILEKKKNLSNNVKALLLLLPLTYLGEGFAHHYGMSKKITKAENVFVIENLSDEYQQAINSVAPNDYQAIIPLPFYYCGSEHFSRPIHDRSSRVSKIFSYHLQIPIMAFDVGRTSIPESKKIVQILSPTYYKKLIANDLTSEKPFLIVLSDELTHYEKQFLNRGNEIIFNGKDFKLLKISKENILKQESIQLNEELSILNDSTYQSGTVYSTDSSFYFYNDFDNNVSEKILFGNGALEFDKRGENIISTFSPNTFQKNKTYSLSLWMFNNQNDALNDWFRLIVEERNPKTNEKKYTTVLPEFSEVIDNEWSMTEIDFKIDFSQNEIRIITIGKDLTADVKIYVDELLIREKDKNVFKADKVDESTWRVMKNGHYSFLKK